MLDWIVEGIRVLIWGLTSACLMLMDVCYNIVIELAAADFLSTKEVWNWYYTALLFLGALIVIRTIAVFLKFSFDEEFQDKVSPSHFFNKIAAICLVLALLPTILGWVSKTAVWGVQHTSIFIGASSDTKPSTLIITSFMNRDNGEYNKKGEWVSGEKVTYTLEDVDINEESDQADEDYKFFNGIGDLFMVAIIGIATAIMLIMNAVQIGKRSYALVMKLMIAPVPISSLIVPGDETFSMWRKMIVSDYVLNFFQTLMIMVVMILAGSKVLSNVSVWAQIISFMSGLLLLLSGIPELSKLLGGDTSQAGVLQQLASFRMATRGVGASIGGTLKKAGGVIGGSGKTLGAYGAYGIGRGFGGKSMKDINQEKANKRDEHGFMGGSEKKDGTGDLGSTPSTDGGVSPTLSAEGDAQSGADINSGPTREFQDFNYSKSGSIAGNFSDNAWNRGGIKGAASNLVKNSSRHMYQASMDRMQRSRAYRATTATKKMISPQDRILGD